MVPIVCLEPGLTRNVIKANLTFNGVDRFVRLRAEAASDTDGVAQYNYAPNVLISGRICSYPSATSHRTVRTMRVDTLLPGLGDIDGAIIKIDTEGHEPSVIAGLGAFAIARPNVCIVEFWPESINATVNGVNYADFIEHYYTVLNIRSSLYPRTYARVEDLRKFAREFDYAEGNVDLMLVGKAIPQVDALMRKLVALAG